MQKKLVTDPRQYADHAHALAHAFGILLIEAQAMPPDQAGAVPALRVILVAPIIEDTTYAAALHEMGHVLAPLGSMAADVAYAATMNRRIALTLEEELAAWEWAEANALDWTPAMDQLRGWSLSTYEQRRVAHETRTTAAKDFLKHRWGWS